MARAPLPPILPALLQIRRLTPELLAAVRTTIGDSGIALGGQDCHAAEQGAHTGDIAAAMLHDAGCTYVIVGHSERRADHGERDPEQVVRRGRAAPR